MPLFGNTLLARVLGHRSTATLYKSSGSDFNVAPADQVASPTAPTAPQARASGPVVMAKLLPRGTALPVGLAIPAENVGRETTSPPATPAPLAQPLPGALGVQSAQPGPSLKPPAAIQQQQARPAIPPAAQAPPPQAAQPPAVVQPPPVVQRSPAAQSPPAAKPDQHDPAKPVVPPSDLPPSVMGDSDFSWIEDSEWNRLKSFAEGHQKHLAQRKAAEETAQLSPEEQERQATKERISAELAQRSGLV